MKKSILFFIAALAVFSFSANAQLFNTVLFSVPSCTTNYSTTIVRVAQSNTEVVSYHSHGQYGEFFLANNNSVLYNFQLPQDMYIKDFQILDNNVFFCGSYLGRGIVGVYRMSLFYGTTISLHYIYTSDISYLKKMCVYYDQQGTNIHVEVIGDKVDSNNDISNCLTDILYDGSLLHYVSSYVLGGPYYPTDEDGIFQDITVTEDYLVVSGREKTGNKLRISRFNKHSVSSGGRFFYYDETPYPETNSTVAIESLDGNNIITAALYINPNSAVFGTRLRTIDVSTMININTQIIPTVDKPVPEEMVFSLYDGTLLLLQKTEYPSNTTPQSVVYELDPYSNNYSANVNYNLNGYYTSMDCFSSQVFILTGLGANMHHCFLLKNRSYTTIGCINKGDIFVSKGQDLAVQEQPRSQYPISFTPTFYQTPVHTVNIKKDCEK